MACKFKTKYDKPKVTGFHFNKPSLTDQSQAYSADINNLVTSCGIVNQNTTPAQFGSVFNPDMYQDALITVAQAKSEFEQLPATVRREFKNDPKEFINFMDSCAIDEANAKKAVKLGLYKPEILDIFKKEVSQPVTDATPSGNSTDPN